MIDDEEMNFIFRRGMPYTEIHAMEWIPEGEVKAVSADVSWNGRIY